MALKFDSSMLELDEGLLNDIIIQFENIEDTLEKAIAKYDYPYADGADLEDMGQKAHQLRFRCHFWDDAEQESYDTHTLLIDSLVEKELIDFIHPKYGLMKGKIVSIVITHDDSVRHVSIELTFIEQMRGKMEVSPPEKVEAAIESAYVEGQKQQESKLLADLKNAFPNEVGAITKTYDSAASLLNQVQESSNEMRTFVGQVEGYIAAAEAVVNEVLSPVNSLQATLIYSANLPGRILGNLTRSIEKVALLYTTLQYFPGRFLASLDDSCESINTALRKITDPGTVESASQKFSVVDSSAAGLDNTYQKMQNAFYNVCAPNTSPAGLAARDIISNHYLIACAQRLALEAAVVFAAEDEIAVASLAGQDNEEDALIQVMNIRELEEALAVVRTRIETAVESAREMNSLKTMALALLNHVNHVRLEREKMISIVLDNSLPLHLVCLKYGLPYRDAERLIKVNNIKNPNYTAGEVLVYARQS